MPPSQEQLSAISITERVCSAVSLVGTFVIVVTFIGSRSFRKPINRLVFYASWGNLMANIATLISQSGMHAGMSSPLCQFQAFLIQWFMPADALWTFAMACNVYLTFFHKYDADQLRQLEWKYAIGCYGLPFIPAFVYFFIHTPSRGRVYGSAILWCWISRKWGFLRIALFYGPVWFVIFLTFAIYLRTGSTIYRKRRELQALRKVESLDREIAMTTDSPHVNFAGIQVTSEIAYSTPYRSSIADPDPDVNVDVPRPARSFSSSTFSPYSVTIEGGTMDSNSMSQNLEDRSPSIHASGSRKNSSIFRSERSASLITSRSEGGVTYETHCQRRRMKREASSAAWAYTKYAMLFFIALLVTWVPSTINRVYSLARPNDFSFGLNYTASFVLPLQGFWNSLIYVSTHKYHAQTTMAGPNSNPTPTDNPTPGLRASRLHQVFDQALARTLRANSYANFAGCFPTPARYVPASLESVWRQLNAKLEESAKAEFEEIIEERDAVRHLNDLDRLVNEAKELYRAHLTPYLQEAQATLNSKLEETHAQNAELAQTVQAQRREIEKLLAHLESVVDDIEVAASAATQFSKERHIRQDAIQMDREVNARPGV
ncbi:hypothetical protein F1880_007317 [Penicillium rolfsii]|nr:hypothetical protein F1880_007317 [Penicillium rolfsii]